MAQLTVEQRTFATLCDALLSAGEFIDSSVVTALLDHGNALAFNFMFLEGLIACDEFDICRYEDRDFSLVTFISDPENSMVW